MRVLLCYFIAYLNVMERSGAKLNGGALPGTHGVWVPTSVLQNKHTSKYVTSKYGESLTQDHRHCRRLLSTPGLAPSLPFPWSHSEFSELSHMSQSFPEVRSGGPRMEAQLSLKGTRIS